MANNDVVTVTANAVEWVMPAGTAIIDLGAKEAHCESHGPYMTTGKRLRLRDVWTSCPACKLELDAQIAREQQEQEAKRRQEALEARLERCLIPQRFLDRSLDSFVADTEPKRKALAVVRTYLDNFPANYRKGRGLILAGKPGTGKSHLATAVLRSILGDFFGLYVTCPDFIRDVRATWHRDAANSEAQVLNDYGRVSLLVLDEVGVAFGTEGEQKHLFDLLDRRYREQKPTIILTNEDAEGLKRYVGERVFDRLTETSEWVSFPWGSYRRTAAKESA